MRDACDTVGGDDGAGPALPGPQDSHSFHVITGASMMRSETALQTQDQEQGKLRAPASDTLLRSGARPRRTYTLAGGSWGARGGAAAVALVTALLIWLLPVVGAIAVMAIVVMIVPLARDLSARIVIAFLIALGATAVVVMAGDIVGIRVLSPDRFRLGLAIVAVVAAGFLLMRPFSTLKPRFDAGLAPLLGVTAVSWFLFSGPALTLTSGDDIGGLMVMGWDHQSHFTIFSSLYEQGGVWDPAAAEKRFSFYTYPPLAGVLSVMMTMLAHPSPLDIDSMVPFYVHTTALLAALGFGLVAWVGYAAARQVPSRLRSRRRSQVAVVASVVLAGALMLGPVSSFYDMGFSNFLLASALGGSASWVVLSVPGARRLVRLTVLAATVASIALLWTPITLLLLGAVIVLGWELIRDRRWLLLMAAVLFGAGALSVIAWQTLRLVPDGAQATTLAGTIAAVGGGLPPVPFFQASGMVVAAALLAAAHRRGHRRPWMTLLLTALGAIVLAGVFTYNTVRTETSAQDSYYVAKATWVLYVVAAPILAALISLALNLVASSVATNVGSRGSARLRTGVVGVMVAALVWGSLASVQTPGGKAGYFSVPTGVQNAWTRWDAYRGIDAGHLILATEDLFDNRPRKLGILWDAGDLLHNRWLASIRGQLTVRNDRVLSALPGAPYLEPARDALQRALAGDPSLRVVVAWYLPATRKLLKPVKQQFPDRLELRRM